jgi:acyl carrier protein phosphodiesterase
LNWERFCPQPLESFNAEFYAAVRAHPIALPADARSAVAYIVDGDRLTSYRSMDGIQLALRRLSKRLSTRFSKRIELDHAIPDLKANFEGIQRDFFEFFPALQKHVDPCHFIRVGEAHAEPKPD